MSPRPHHRVLVRVRWKLSGATWLWLIDRDGTALLLKGACWVPGGVLLIRLAEPLR